MRAPAPSKKLAVEYHKKRNNATAILSEGVEISLAGRSYCVFLAVFIIVVAFLRPDVQNHADSEEIKVRHDCRKGKIDSIWTKSVSRFGRNTVDTLVFTRELRSLGIDVFFEKENIHSMDATGEMMLTLMAAFAESEAEAMSDNIKWGKRRRFEQGLVETITVHNLNGYTQKNGEVAIVESEAEIVRRIYQEFLDGYNMNEIARRLNDDGIPTKKRFHAGPERRSGISS